jgi:hypothetical protein
VGVEGLRPGAHLNFADLVTRGEQGEQGWLVNPQPNLPAVFCRQLVCQPPANACIAKVVYDNAKNIAGNLALVFALSFALVFVVRLATGFSGKCGRKIGRKKGGR